MVKGAKIPEKIPSLMGPSSLTYPEISRPSYFPDLHLDELEGLLFSAQTGYGLEGFFRSPLRDGASLAHRQAVAQELEEGEAPLPLRGFLRTMEAVRGFLGLAEKTRHFWQKALYFLQAAGAYIGGLESLRGAWEKAFPRSQGLRSYAAYLVAYQEDPAFSAFRREVAEAKEGLDEVRYRLHVHEGRLVLQAHQGGEDYGERVKETFRPFFGPGGSKVPRLPQGAPGGSPWLNHIEEWILDRLAELFPQAFARVGSLYQGHQGFVDPVLMQLEREARFFLAYLDFIAPLRKAGLPFTYPEAGETPPYFAQEAFDLVLGAKLVAEGKKPVLNDFLVEGERILLVSGANQGGKTTFARMVGQLHHLFALGLPVPGRRARLGLPDRILTHFEARENPEDPRSKLEADLVRLKELLDQASPQSLVLLNEPLASAALLDARAIGRFLLDRLREKGSLTVMVTFLDELARLKGVKSLVAEVDPKDPAQRTFRIRERPADGKAYALSLAEKYGLTYDALRGRLGGGA
ncbi:MAG: DNA mismatch repair protein MutS [Thermus sp.]|nr:DNA mismatch repair protein MutS [Thermus sp.]